MPKIVTTLEDLRRSGKVCPKGYAQLLRSQGKTKADRSPIDVADLIDPLGHHAVMRGFALYPEHQALFRALAVQFARDVVHLIADRKEAEGLALVAAFLDGQAGEADFRPIRSPDFAPGFELPVDEWPRLSCEGLAVCSIAATALEDGTRAPYFAALAAELAQSKAASRPKTFMRVEIGRDGGIDAEELAVRWVSAAATFEAISDQSEDCEQREARATAEARHTAILRDFLTRE